MTKQVSGQAWTKHCSFRRLSLGEVNSITSAYKLNLFYIPSKVFDQVFIQRFQNTRFIVVVFCELYASFEYTCILKKVQITFFFDIWWKRIMTFPFRIDFSKFLFNSSKFLSSEWYLFSRILIDFNKLLSFLMKTSQNLFRFVFLLMFFDRTDDKGLNLYTRSSLQGKQGLLFQNQ